MNGVAPISFSRVFDRFARLVILAFTWAPRATSFFTSRWETAAVAAPACAVGGDRLVHVGACLQQHAHDVGAPFADGEQQRREPGREASAQVGAHFDEHLRDVGVAFRRRPHERGLFAIVLTAHIHAAHQQRFH